MFCYAYEVITCDEKEGTEKPSGQIVLSHLDNLDQDPYGDDNPCCMGSNQYLRPLYDGERVIVHGAQLLRKPEKE